MIMLERAMQVLRAEMRAGTAPKSTSFKRKHDDLKGAMSKVEQHLRFDGDVERYMNDKNMLGIIPRAIEQIFYELDEKIYQQLQMDPHFQADSGYTVYCSFL